MNRMQFLRGKTNSIRPPWSVDESLFTEKCSRCSDCMPVCHDRIIEKGRGGFPIINFQNGECDFCGKCVEACSTGALQQSMYRDGAEPWNLKARITEACLNYKDVVCRSCGDRCIERSIRFRPQIGGKLDPELNTENCTGCGACFAPCPVSAITITPVSNEQETLNKSRLEDCA